LGLSVLIPVYNRDVTLLVSALATLLTKKKIVSEIILLDDASELIYDHLNHKLAESDFIFYFRNEENQGREQSRRLLAEKAKYAHLLFLDCDVKIIRPDFIQKYYEQVRADVPVCSGGLEYVNEQPEECKFRLHWNYGKQRESKRVGGQGVFLSSNFLIRKDLFLGLNFSSPLKLYGHEDTLWGIELKKKSVAVKNIDNPVLHEGLEENAVYINKSLEAVENLIELEKIVGDKLLAEHVKLYSWYKKLSGWRLTGLAEKYERWNHASIIKNLNSCKPDLKKFDLMRLAHLIRIKKRSRI
jgi:glycosyltransferase involved in cell wall biosynthesis